MMSVCNARKLIEYLYFHSALKQDISVQHNGQDLIIAADTVVITDDGEILEKPEDQADAKATLKRLSGETHSVKTIMLLMMPETAHREVTWMHNITETRVTFRDLEDEFIEQYVASGHPMDKSGSYGYMEHGAALVSSITGDYFNVIGFSAATFARLVKTFYKAE